MLRSLPSVFVIRCQTKSKWKISDLGQSENVVESIIYHERAAMWKRICSGTIRFSAVYIQTKAERHKLERTIKNSKEIQGERYRL